ncbi:serA [Symbiodinium natans]|uniref:SerA protein n=1 Tax=Symbiodinium natans TaxID=878477 RepID=A0A812I601_9DINO|nr:serA [Symbiodinium natans]
MAEQHKRFIETFADRERTAQHGQWKMRTGNRCPAGSQATAGPAAEPSDAEANLLLAEALLAAGQAPAAERPLAVASARPVASLRSRILQAQAKVALFAEDFKKAMSLASEAVRMEAGEAGDVKALLALAEVRIQFADYDAALRALSSAEQALRVETRKPVARTLLAQTCGLAARANERLRRFPEALEESRRATDLDPTQGPARLARAMALQQTGRADEAEMELRELLRHQPKDCETLTLQRPKPARLLAAVLRQLISPLLSRASHVRFDSCSPSQQWGAVMPASPCVNDTTGDDVEALRFALHVLRGLTWRNGPGPSELSELSELQLQGDVGDASTLACWGLWRCESHRIWKEHLSQKRRAMDSSPITGLPRFSEWVVVLIEMREHEDLEVVLRSAMSLLEFVEQIVRTWSFVHLHCLPMANFTREGYANFRRSQDLLSWINAAGGKLALFVECDSLLLRPGLERFLCYDLVGAPWSWAEEAECQSKCPEAHRGLDHAVAICRGISEAPVMWHHKFISTYKYCIFTDDNHVFGNVWSEMCCAHAEQTSSGLSARCKDRACVGNGGFSVRHCDFLHAALDHMQATAAGEVAPPWPSRNEDMCFAHAAIDLAARVPSRKVAQEFSVETIFHPTPIGCHKPWQYLLPSDMRRLLQIWELAD